MKKPIDMHLKYNEYLLEPSFSRFILILNTLLMNTTLLLQMKSHRVSLHDILHTLHDGVASWRCYYLITELHPTPLALFQFIQSLPTNWMVETEFIQVFKSHQWRL